MSKFKAGKTGDTLEAKKKATISKTGPGKMKQGDTAGVQSGLSERYSCNVDENEPKLDYGRDPMTGNATERIKPRKTTSVSSKGKTFMIET